MLDVVRGASGDGKCVGVLRWQQLCGYSITAPSALRVFQDASDSAGTQLQKTATATVVKLRMQITWSPNHHQLTDKDGYPTERSWRPNAEGSRPIISISRMAPRHWQVAATYRAAARRLDFCFLVLRSRSIGRDSRTWRFRDILLSCTRFILASLSNPTLWIPSCCRLIP